MSDKRQTRLQKQGKRKRAQSRTAKMPKRQKASSLGLDLPQTEQHPHRTNRNRMMPLIPSHHRGVAPSVLKLISALLSKPTIVAFCDLVRARRSAETPLRYWTADDGAAYQMEQRLINLRSLRDKSAFGRFLVRAEELGLARAMECKRKGRIRNDSNDVRDTLKRCELTYNTFKWHQTQGGKWLRLCRPYPGILCFLLAHGHNVFGISQGDYLGLSDHDLDSFHALLDCEQAQTLNAIGQQFLDSLSPIADDVEFLWEGKEVLWDNLSTTEALTKLATVPWKMENDYAPNDYPGWPRPLDWPDEWGWPMDPTALPAFDQPKCDFCPQSQCDCVHTKLTSSKKPKPRIKEYGEKGRGIQAVATDPGQVAYACGECIGVVWGKVAPVDAHTGSMVMDFVRPDILYEPVACQLYCEDRGSNLRLINHSCRPSARVEPMKVSGKWILVVVAARAIFDREEITAKFGKASFDGPCLCGCANPTEPLS
ncbi:uncharacterized protein HMPREF1541_00019 [Cyphellophora europaea CBS 101466]|uniref:SET domain-containing protein n=1 Tax=Cyphellophora europaea (strain CBS 101466) TaxID=1220924 RepID=W2SCT5_CYPE1|nr:uncharacterized protein HMPREF1541_00019 [Cyphellophora europaea CBS 101466]ETN45838.1 hypothetical protein HMPREF1541_00019 [Cyphellophora europaea CBS 101466]